MRGMMLMGLLLMGASVAAQDNTDKGPATVSYGGQRVSLLTNTLQVRHVAPLQGVQGEGYQGMEVYGDTLLSAQNSGWLSVYTYDGNTLTQRVKPYRMACYNKVNHCNVMSFSNYRYAPQDPLPLLYVSQCARQPWQGMKDVLFVERLDSALDATHTVQVIHFRDDNHLFGYALQWVIDRENDMLYGYGNTVNNTDKANRHRIVKFRLPAPDEGVDGIVTLTEKDLLENYLLEETYNRPFMPIGQGLFIRNGQLFMPTGFGSDKQPSVLYVWNLETRSMQNVIDLRRATFSELEDCAAWRDVLLLQGQGHLFRLDF